MEPEVTPGAAAAMGRDAVAFHVLPSRTQQKQCRAHLLEAYRDSAYPPPRTVARRFCGLSASAAGYICR